MPECARTEPRVAMVGSARHHAAAHNRTLFEQGERGECTACKTTLRLLLETSTACYTTQTRACNTEKSKKGIV